MNDSVMVKLFIGYDKCEIVAYHAFCQSVISNSSIPVSFVPISLSHLKGFFTRERHPLQSTDFSFSRFLVPYLCGYEGWAIFMDCDMLLTGDIAELWALRDEQYAVQVVKHNHKPSETKKFLDQPQTAYAKKNWSSVMLFNNEKCRALTPEYVNTAAGLELHQFKWLEESQIGSLPAGWNYLVDVEGQPECEIKNLHYTLGGPYFSDYRDCSYAEEWFAAFEELKSCKG